jgi:hypothetical protein
MRECYGEFVLETESVRALGLGVVDDDADSPDYQDNHAEITGLPPYENKKLAEDRAGELTEISALHWDRFDRFR